jgi:glycolate oxidase FAD binding subunit
MDAALRELSERVQEAGRSKRLLRIRGGGSKDFYGQALEGEVLDTRGHSGIVSYEPSELVVTARCGTRLAEIEAAMRERGQMLAFEPPHFGEAATLGGAVAAGLSGPGRQAAGALRDFVLGVRIMDGRGDALAFGGQVMKNVAGYDVSRLMAGSLGTLGIILEVSLKALPLPVAEATLRLELPEDRAIAQLNRWGGKPLPISASAWTDDALLVRLGGAAAAVEEARAKIGGERVDHAEARQFWSGALPSTTPPLGLQGEQLIEWGGALRWLFSHADARTVRDAATRAGGHATLFRGGDKAVGVFQPLAPALMKIHKQLKREFDPHGIFNRGRMYSDL